MFFKFLWHDMSYGIFSRKKKFLAGFCIFFCLSFYHFLTLRIYEITFPEYFSISSTTADYFMALVGGCGVPEIQEGIDVGLTMPVMWLGFMLWMQFVSLYYPFTDLLGFGKHVMLLSGNRSSWWFSKCLWAVGNTAINYILIFLISTLCGLCTGGKLSLQTNWYVARELNMRLDLLTFEDTKNILPFFFLSLLVLIALSLLQMTLSLAISPMFSYFFLAAYLIAGIYYQNAAFLGNYAMAARSDIYISTGLSAGPGILVALWVIFLNVFLGYLLLGHKDLLGGGEG